MLVTIIRDVYKHADRRELFDAIDELCSPADALYWASAGVYVYWSPDTREVLYIGMARDLWERFGHHNGLIRCDANNCKRVQIETWFASHATLGYAMLVQSSLEQPITSRSVQAWSGANSNRLSIESEFGDVHNDTMAYVAAVEGGLIGAHRARHGTLPVWNRIGGSRSGSQNVGAADATLLDLIVGVADRLNVARATVRELAASPVCAFVESHIHAARMQAQFLGGTSIRAQLKLMANVFGDSVAADILGSGWLDRPAPFLQR